MSIKVECGICGARKRVSDSLAGGRVDCSECGASINVPEETSFEEDVDSRRRSKGRDADDDSDRYSSNNSTGILGVVMGAGVVLILIVVAAAFVTAVARAPAPPVAQEAPRPAPKQPRLPDFPHRAVEPVVRPREPHPAIETRPSFKTPTLPEAPEFSTPGSITINRPPTSRPPSQPSVPNFPSGPQFGGPPFPGAPRTAPGTDPVVVESFAPHAGSAGTTVTLKGRGFASAERVLFLEGTTDLSATFNVVSDSELQVTVPELKSDAVAVPIAVIGPAGMAITFPRNAPTLTLRKQNAIDEKFVVIGIGPYDGEETSRIVLVQRGGMVMKGGSGNVFLLQNSAVMPRPDNNGNLVIHARRAIVPFRKTGTSRYVPVEEIYPSFVETLFNDPAAAR